MFVENTRHGYHIYVAIRICLCPKLELQIFCTVKPALSGHSKIDKTKVLKTNGS